MTRKKKGILLIIIGVSILPLSLFGWSISRFTITQLATAQLEQQQTQASATLGAQTTSSILNIIFSLLPLIGLFILTPIGIVTMLREEKKSPSQ